MHFSYTLVEAEQEDAEGLESNGCLPRTGICSTPARLANTGYLNAPPFLNNGNTFQVDFQNKLIVMHLQTLCTNPISPRIRDGAVARAVASDVPAQFPRPNGPWGHDAPSRHLSAAPFLARCPCLDDL